MQSVPDKQPAQSKNVPLRDMLRACTLVLSKPEPSDKALAAQKAGALAEDVGKSEFSEEGVHNSQQTSTRRHDAPLPDRPSRPDRPVLVDPQDVPRRKLGGEKGRIALLHAVAHIELNAIDLAFDMAARFYHEIARLGLNHHQFIKDWVFVGVEEARHFSIIQSRLISLGASYGDLPAHDGLWDAALGTADSVLARLAIAPMVLEARGLDVTPGMISKLRGHGDIESAEILQIIYNEEIGHVAKGTKWFTAVCDALDKNPVETFDEMVATRFTGQLKPPFNELARTEAGLDLAFYKKFIPKPMEDCAKS